MGFDLACQILFYKINATQNSIGQYLLKMFVFFFPYRQVLKMSVFDHQINRLRHKFLDNSNSTVFIFEVEWIIIQTNKTLKVGFHTF